MKLPRHAEIWLVPYLKDRLRKSRAAAQSRSAPGLPSPITTSRWAWAHPLKPRSAAWRSGATSGRALPMTLPRDAAGQCPQYSFFYPQEEYRRDLLDGIAEMVRLGVGDVEVHLHHDNEQRDSFIRKVTEYCRRLTDDHGLLRQQDGRTVFGFIHGNWALDNSRPDGKWCGLNGEIALLRDLGCYADFTMPSASLGDPGARCEPDLLVHEQPRQSSQILRSRNRSHCWRRQARRPADDHRAARFALRRTADAAPGNRRDRRLRPANARAGAPMVRSGSHHRRRSFPEALHPRRARRGISSRCLTAASAISSAGSRKKPTEEASRFTGPRPGRCTRLPMR